MSAEKTGICTQPKLTPFGLSSNACFLPIFFLPLGWNAKPTWRPITWPNKNKAYTIELFTLASAILGMGGLNLRNSKERYIQRFIKEKKSIIYKKKLYFPLTHLTEHRPRLVKQMSLTHFKLLTKFVQSHVQVDSS